MKVVEAPQLPPHYQQPAIFLAGGITNCSDWQTDLIKILEEKNYPYATIFNPRRAQWPEAADALKEQIQWEFMFLWKSQILVFWFSKETLCPITLYELGTHLTRFRLLAADNPNRPRICIGVDPEYKRKADLEIQRGFLAPDVPMVDSLDKLAEFIMAEAQKFNEAE